jgi:hypothetical protein
MNNLDKAQQAANFDLNELDYETLLGILINLKKWVIAEPELLKLNKKSILCEWKKDGHFINKPSR